MIHIAVIQPTERNANIQLSRRPISLSWDKGHVIVLHMHVKPDHSCSNDIESCGRLQRSDHRMLLTTIILAPYTTHVNTRQRRI